VYSFRKIVNCAETLFSSPALQAVDLNRVDISQPVIRPVTRSQVPAVKPLPVKPDSEETMPGASTQGSASRKRKRSTSTSGRNRSRVVSPNVECTANKAFNEVELPLKSNNVDRVTISW
jgi:hypothetical protein